MCSGWYGSVIKRPINKCKNHKVRRREKILRITGDPLGCCGCEEAGAGIPAVICLLNAALSSFQVFIQGGCVKYYDPSPLSPASVASGGKRLAASRTHARPERGCGTARYRQGALAQPGSECRLCPSRLSGQCLSFFKADNKLEKVGSGVALGWL